MLTDRRFQEGSAQERLVLAADTESGVAHTARFVDKADLVSPTTRCPPDGAGFPCFFQGSRGCLAIRPRRGCPADSERQTSNICWLFSSDCVPRRCAQSGVMRLSVTALSWPRHGTSFSLRRYRWGGEGVEGALPSMSHTHMTQGLWDCHRTFLSYI